MKLVHHLAIDLEGTRKGTRRPDGPLLGTIHRLTGLFGQSFEEETLSMLQLVDRTQEALGASGVTNIVRLVLDARVVYDDRSGRDDDLKEALERAASEGLSAAQRIQLVLEQEDDDFYRIVTLTVHPRHDPGFFPIWIRIASIGQDLVMKKRQRLSTFEPKIREIFSDPEAVEALSTSWTKTCDEQVDSIEQSLQKVFSISTIERSSHLEFESNRDDYYFAYRPEVFRSIDLLQSLAAELLPAGDRAKASTLSAFAARGKKTLAAMEKKLAKKRSKASPRPAATRPLGWKQFARKRVLNPATGKICQIANLPGEHQRKYRALFNAETLDESQRVELSTDPGFLDRVLGTVGRGLTRTVSASMSQLRGKSPNTYAFLQDESYRKKVMSESGKMIGLELYDQADVLAHTLVGELIESAKVPFIWVTGTGGDPIPSEKRMKHQEEAFEQMVDMMELTVGTIVPIGAWAAGGPLGGAIGLVGIKMFQKALNWYSKKYGGREWTIRPSRMIARQEAIRKKRIDDWEQVADRIETERAEAFERLQIEAGSGEISEATRQEVERELADSLRDFGNRLQKDQVELTEEDLSLDSIKEQDLLIALQEEADASSSSKSS